ncbi:MAG: nickel pincer cofactor biosynthesis protein LarC [Planctomycetota bacterium]
MPQKRILHLDPFSGISGDMFVGALLDLGVDLAKLAHEVSKLELGGYHLSSKRVFRGAMTAIKFDVEIAGILQTEFDAKPADITAPSHGHEHGHSHGHDHSHDHNHSGDTSAPETQRRNFKEIKTLLQSSRLSDRVKITATAAFQKLADAEGRIHNMPPDDVAFHEVGALDSIIDFVAVCAGLEMLGIDEVWCGPLALGRGGFVKCDHGLMPVPAPATLEIVKGIPLRDTPVEKELTTPTGAALIAALTTKFCTVPDMRSEKIGYGAGSREQQLVPNVLRATLGTTDDTTPSDSVIELRANIDDATPEALGHLMDVLLAAGALDVFFTPIQMKKNRPATLVTALIAPNQLDSIADIFFKESSTFGLRYETLNRLTLTREFITVETQFGPAKVKIGQRNGTVYSIHPEYDDCKSLAQKSGTALKDVIVEALSIAKKSL